MYDYCHIAWQSSNLYMVISASLIVILTIGMVSLFLYVYRIKKHYKSTIEELDSHIVKENEFLKQTEERYKLIVEAAHDGIWDYDVNKKIRFQSYHWLKELGYEQDQFLYGNSWYELIHPKDRANIVEKINEHLEKQTDYYECEYRIKNSNNHYIWIKERGRALFDKEGRAYRIAGSHTDITNMKNYEEALEFIAYSDPLTSLPNRRYLEEVIVKEFEELSSIHKQKALIYLDMDNFKIINDSLGHLVGDRVIISIGCKLSKFVSNKVKLFRLGGDELIFYLSEYESKDQLKEFVKAVMKTLEEPIDLGDNVIHTSASIGIATYPSDGKNIEELLKKADIAMYKAKEEGRNKYKFFNKSFSDSVKKLVSVEASLRKGIVNQEFILYYQPKVNVSTMKVTGFEALIRWESSDLGFMPPIDFIGVAEYTGLIIPIGNWVIQAACQFIKELNHTTGVERIVSVNVSAVQLMQENFNKIVLDIVDKSEINPKWLELEITETVLIKSASVIVHGLKELREHGIKIALDDFGKEYSSLNYLKNLPIDILKIDKIFIDDISKQNNKDSIVDIVVALGQKMQLDIIAEGVESKEQVNYLVKNNCHNVQGYIFSKPVPEAKVVGTINRIEGMSLGHEEELYEKRV
ncbi:MAG: putative bifunctional diguanylate cyclase/phosphodiesterase [Cellulosilyticaceae bacterium]